jgi:hypothetical protein
MKPNITPRFTLWLATLAIAVLAACAQLGIAPADTFAKKLAAGYTSTTAVAQTATSLLIAGTITPAEAQRARDGNAKAITALDAAGLLAKTDLATAETRLQATILLLTELQAQLAAKQGAKK